MRKLLLFILLLIPVSVLNAQLKQIEAAIQKFSADPVMKHGSYGLYIIDAKTGKLFFEKNGQMGLAPASTQKLLVSVAAFEILGSDFRFKTVFGYQDIPGAGSAELEIFPSGDPSLGSWRYSITKPENIMKKLREGMKIAGIKRILPSIRMNDTSSDKNHIPRGWIWEDVGNYYGAGASSFIWRENQYDIILRSGSKIGDPVEVAAIKPSVHKEKFIVDIKSAAKGSGDNAYVFWYPSRSDHSIIQGTIPVQESAFEISASVRNPVGLFFSELNEELGGITLNGEQEIIPGPGKKGSFREILVHYSPTLDSLNYWFEKRSINLYGEALINAIGYKTSGISSTEKGVETVKAFWKKNGLDEGSVNIVDGSGLSPQNRITAYSLVKALEFAKRRPWFNSFYNSLPEYNGMRMKSGSIGGARSFAGYHKSKTGKEYIFAFIVNNYEGSGGEVVRKMYGVLDVIK